jgi:hypothetical protein
MASEGAPKAAVSGDWEEQVRRVVASLSESMYELTSSPVGALQSMAASPSTSVADLASLGRNLETLSASASFAASMSRLMASFVAGMERVMRPKG